MARTPQAYTKMGEALWSAVACHRFLPLSGTSLLAVYRCAIPGQVRPRASSAVQSGSPSADGPHSKARRHEQRSLSVRTFSFPGVGLEFARRVDMTPGGILDKTESSATAYQPIRSPRGNQISCKGWQQEAAMRMLMNNLDEEVAERPQELIIYGGTGKAARNWDCYHAIVAALKKLENDETLLVQSGKPVGVFRTHEWAPRVLIANANLVGHWATWEKFRRLEKLGLIMFGQMTAGSWIYIGTQGILQGTFETFVAARRAYAKRTSAADAAPAWVLTAGLGGMGGAQPLAATMAGLSCLAIEVDPSRIAKRLATRYVDERIDDLDAALARLDVAGKEGRPVSIAVCANAAEVYPELVRRKVIPDLVTEQTS